MTHSLQFLCCLFILFLFLHHQAQADEETKTTYIIHLDKSFKPNSFHSSKDWHRFLSNSLSIPILDYEFLYSYSSVIHGFSARLTPSQLAEIESLAAHVATQEDTFGKFSTTYSQKFLGLSHNYGLWPATSLGEGTILGVLDTGIWPESPSFADEGMPAAPKKWKGNCSEDRLMPFKCNRKLIGAQVFTKGTQMAYGRSKDKNPDFVSVRDYYIHGTHTSSIAAGNFVPGASQYGFASGTASGMAPRSHLAMYKVGNSFGCAASDVLAGMDKAVSDGVDVMSISLTLDPVPYFADKIAVAALSAVEKGVSVVCSAGNEAYAYSTNNGAPWITTVGAGTMDRITFAAEMALPDGSIYQGISKFPLSVHLSNVSLFYKADDFNKSICQMGSLNLAEVADKVLLCRNSTSAVFEQGNEIMRVQPIVAIVVVESKFIAKFVTDSSVPIMVLPDKSGAAVLQYAERETEPMVKSMRFLRTTFGGIGAAAPAVAYYSSRGPDPMNPSILKPDIIAPGTDILAAVPPFAISGSMGKYELDSDYAVLSGTSMAAPHVAGVVALLKSSRPDWSPAAIRSAIMTTANNAITDEITGLPATPLDYGAGLINPNGAMNPGLIYDLDFEDYMAFVCGLHYTEKQMRILLRGRGLNCSRRGSVLDLNLPSFVADFNNRSPRGEQSRNFKRALTRIDDGGGSSIYRAELVCPPGLTISVKPRILKFSDEQKRRSFKLKVEIKGENPLPPVLHGRLSWVDDKGHRVSSPVVAIL